MTDLDGNDVMVVLEPFFGHIEVQTRFVPCENGMVGQSRALHYDQHGTLVKATDWNSSGARLLWE